jgi:glucosamine--fructose-6-phosphate aminotransferase (isomerizing)
VETAVVRELAGRERFDAMAERGLLTTVGRGLDFAAACESALKLRELSGIPAEGFSPPDLIHGPVGALDRAGALWIVAGATAIEPDALEALVRIRERTGLTVAVAADPHVLELADIPVVLDAGLPDWAAAIVAVIPAQAAAFRLAELRGVDVDHPHGLTKVTPTR